MSELQVKCCHGNTVDKCDGTCTDDTRCTPPSDQPKTATDEWTVFGTSVKRLGDDDSLFHCSTRTDADVAIRTHNAALAAERERRRTPRNGGEMSEEPGEWTKDILDELSKRLPAGYHFGQLVADAHNAALAAVEKVRDEWVEEFVMVRDELKSAAEYAMNLHKQLAAERVRGQQECNRLDAFWQNEIARQLAAEREKWKTAEDLTRDSGRLHGQLAAERAAFDEVKEQRDEWQREALKLRQQLAAERDALATVRELREHDQKALAAVREKCSYSRLQVDLAEARRDNEQLRSQLAACSAATRLNPKSVLDAAIAAAQKPLVDALTRIRSESLSWTELQNIAAAALAKVKP